MYTPKLKIIMYMVVLIIPLIIVPESLFLPEPAIINNYNMIQLGLYFESNNSYIQYIKDIFNNQYLLKQKKSISFDKMILYSVRDIFAAIIAHRIGIPLNKVWFIAPNKDFPGKKIPNHPATLHTVVPGVVLASVKDLSPKIRIKQWSAQRQPHAAGLTELVIRSMAFHKDLPRLVAFDTLTSNADRHNRNLFYDATTDKFYGIDMDSTLRLESKIVSSSCDNVIKIIDDTHILFSQEELEALQSYKQTLQHFLCAFTLKRLHALVDECFRKTAFIVKNKRDTTISAMHTILNQNYEGIQKLITLLEKLLQVKKALLT